MRQWPVQRADRAGVVLVHGLASTSRLWDGVAESLASSGCPVVAVDLRGHGESDEPPGGYDSGTAADDVIALIPQVSAGAVLLAGQSWGGNVALQVAARRPDLVRGLALVDGGWINLRERFATWDDALSALTPPAIDGMSAGQFRAMLASSLPGFPDGALDAAASVVRVLDDGTIRRRLSVDHHLQILRSMWDDDPARWYPLVTSPSVLLAATLGDLVPPAVAEATRRLAQARLQTFPGAHHDIHLQQPDKVAAEIWSLL